MATNLILVCLGVNADVLIVAWWLRRWVVGKDIDNVVIDSSRIEVNQ